jgi:DNA-binding NtrC family response regulator
MRRNESAGVLCVGCSDRLFQKLSDLLQESELRILGPLNREEAVAVCAAQAVALIVLDGASIRGQEWSVAKSLKMVRPTLPIILLGKHTNGPRLPDGVDALIPLNGLDRLLSTVRGLLNPSCQHATGSQ